MTQKTKGQNIIFPIIFSGLTILLGAIGWWIWNDVKSDVYIELTNATNLLDRYYELTFKHREQSLQTLGQRLEDLNGDDQDSTRQRIINQSLTMYDDLAAIGFADTSGQIITLTGFGPMDQLPNLAKMPETRRSFYEAKQSQKLVIGEVYFFDVVQEWIIPIRVPIRENGVLMAVNTSAISYQNLLDNLQSFGFSEYLNVHVINDKHKTTQIYFPLPHEKYWEVLHQSSEVYEVQDSFLLPGRLTAFEGFSQIQQNDVLGVSSSPGYYNHHVVTTVPYYVMVDQYWDVFQYILLAYFILMAVTSMAYWYFSSTENKFITELQAERDFSTNIINHTPALIIGLNKDLQAFYINPTAQKVLGYTIEDEPFDWWRTLLRIEKNESLPPEIVNIKHKELTSFSQPILDNEDSLKQIVWNSANVLNAKNELKEIILFGHDQTEREKALQQVKEREANLKGIFESTQSMIVLFNKNKEILEYNKSFEQFVSKVRGKTVNEVTQDFDSVYNEIVSTLLDKTLNGNKINETIKAEFNGHTYFLLLNFNPILQEAEVTGVSMFVEDITALKTSEEQLKKYSEDLEEMVAERTIDLQETNDRLQEINEELSATLRELKDTQNQLIQTEKMASLGILSAGIGHEINNPLNFIKNGAAGLKEILSQEQIKDAETVNTFLDIIDQGVNRASNIVKSLSHFSRSGQAMNESCDLADIIDNSLTILQNRLKHKVNVHKHFDHQAQRILGNSGKLHQALLNILSNAEQAIQEEGTIEINTRIEKNRLVITISDTGIGIAEEHLSRISDPFFTTKDPGEGTGLGLSITYSIIKEHKGHITVSSEKNKGTTFTVYLPIN